MTFHNVYDVSTNLMKLISSYKTYCYSTEQLKKTMRNIYDLQCMLYNTQTTGVKGLKE